MGASLSDAGAWWLTVRPDRRVLLLAPAITSVHRLLDLAELFCGDMRVQLTFTVPPSLLGDGTEALLRAIGAPLLPWQQAVARRHDLAVTANLGGMAEIDAPVAFFSHGASRNKLAAPRGRGSIPVLSKVPAFARSALVQNGMLVPSAIALGHDRDLAMLAEDCPEALPVGRVVGDPCFDRISAGRRRLRATYRRALGLKPREKLVVVTSTWSTASLLGGAPHQLERLVEQLRGPGYRVVLLIHPNVFAAHGEYQLRAWWGHLVHNGLILTQAGQPWEPFLIAADYIVGDHGSVTLYGSLAGVPVLLGAYDEAHVHPESGAAALARIAPRLVGSVPVPEQLAQADRQFDAEAMASVAALISSEPGGFARHTRALLYGMLGLGQPAVPPRVPDAPLPPSLRELAARSLGGACGTEVRAA
jgi:hypothetical protein